MERYIFLFFLPLSLVVWRILTNSMVVIVFSSIILLILLSCLSTPGSLEQLQMA